MRPRHLAFLMLAWLASAAAQAADPDCASLTYGAGIDDATDCTVLNAGGTAFNGLLRNEGSEVGVILMHGRNTAFDGQPMVHHPNAVVVQQLRTHLAGLGYSTLSIETPNIPLSANLNGNGTADFFEYDANNADLTAQVFARINAAIDELAAQSVQRVVLAGFSMGSRYATAATAAANLGLLGNSLDVVGLIGVGMYANLASSTPTAATPTSLADINGYDTLNNLAFVSVPVLDIYGNLDGQAAATAADRLLAYGGAPGDYTQVELTCPDFNSQPYFWRRSGVYLPYTENRCHQLRNGFLYDGLSGTYTFDVALVNGPDRPLESTTTAWMVANDGFAVPAPVASSLLLLGVGALGLAGRARRRDTV